MAASTNKLLVKQLIEFGLSEKEAQVYLATLELEVATVNEIAKKADVKRSSTYVVLESLKKKGFVGISDDKKVQNYVASSPDLLLHEAENRAKKSEEVKNKINNILSELKALHRGTKHRPKVKVFEGKQGLINAFEDTLNNKEKVFRVASSVENIVKILPDYFPEYVKRRVKLGIKMYGIHPRDEIARKLIKIIPKTDRIALIPIEKYKFPADIAIYDNKIGFMSSEGGGFAIGIESKELADIMKSLFDMAYKEARRLSKNCNK